MKTRSKWVIALAVVIGGIWLMGVFYVLSYKPDVYVNPGAIVSSSSPVATPIQPSRYHSIMSHDGFIRHTMYIQPTSYTVNAPEATMQPSYGLYMTSSATTHSVGGGDNSAYGMYSSSHSSSSRGIIYSTTGMPTTNFIALASNRKMANPEAPDAPQMAHLAPRNAPGPPDLGGETTPPDHQLVEQPLNDGIWILMMASAIYGLWRLRKMKSERQKVKGLVG